MLGAVGEVKGFGITEAGKALIRKMVQGKKRQLVPESQQKIKHLGSGFKKF